MKRLNIETAVGLFLIMGFLCFAYLSIKLGDVHLWGSEGYPITAKFSSVSGLKDGAIVEIGGVQIGKVASISLDQEDYEAVVRLTINPGIKLQDDCIASIRTAGIIGDRYVDITPGADEKYLGPNGEILETESAINLEQLVSKYIFEKK
jgi:phospholipid/cholesterol/gamma-HCH transport system substrate-binding protein